MNRRCLDRKMIRQLLPNCMVFMNSNAENTFKTGAPLLYDRHNPFKTKNLAFRALSWSLAVVLDG